LRDIKRISGKDYVPTADDIANLPRQQSSVEEMVVSLETFFIKYARIFGSSSFFFFGLVTIDSFL
jgi:hypothetical protein